MSDTPNKFAPGLPHASPGTADPSVPRSSRRPVLSARGTSEAPREKASATPRDPWRAYTSALDRGLKLSPVPMRVKPAVAARPAGNSRNGSTVYCKPEDAKRRKGIISQVTHNNTWILAIGMMEGCDLDANYPLGDTFPAQTRYQEPKLQVPTAATPAPSPEKLKLDRPLTYGNMVPQRKTGGAANYGAFKMNWYMIRQTATGLQLQRQVLERFPRLTADELADAVGSIINEDMGSATQIILEAWNKWQHEPPDINNPITSKFWAGHRWGQTGLLEEQYEHFADVRRYYDGVRTIKTLCDGDPDVWKNDKRYWCEVPAI